ncbi:MAG: autotransporter assembly complex family protein [Hyphomonadaceae bacterium]
MRMAFGGPAWGQASRVLFALAVSLCALSASPALAQDDQAPSQPITAQPVANAQNGSSAAGRVPVEGAPDAVAERVKGLQREEAAPETLFDARRQAERAAAIVSTVMESEGYYQAEVEPFAEGQNTFSRGVRVTPGPLFIYASRRIAYIGATPDQTTVTELDTLLAPIETGVPARAQPVIETGDAIVARLRAAGYPDAKSDPVDVLADAKTGTIEIEFRLRPGLRASFGKLAVSGLGETKEQFIANLRPWKDGERVTPQRLDEFRGRLAETGLFSSTSVRLDAAPSADGQTEATRDVVVELKERERRTIAIGASASTSDGFGLDAEWQLRNWSGWGDTVAIAGQLATLERRIGASYRLPHIGKYGRILKLATEIEDFETDAFDQSGANVSATLEEQLSPRVRGSLGVEAGYASILDAQGRATGAGRRDVYIISGTGTAEYVGVKDILDPVNGIRARVAVEPGFTWGDTNIAFTKVSGEASAYSDFGTKDFVGAVRGRIGTIAGPNGAPPDRLFFAGGGGSVRGYEYQSLSPRDALGQLAGGRSLIEVSTEVRYRWTDTLGFVAFLDGGAAGSNVEPPIDSMRFGTGIGLRYYTAFGPLRADIAVPLNKETGDADFQIYISIGQAF